MDGGKGREATGAARMELYPDGAQTGVGRERPGCLECRQGGGRGGLG